MSESTSTERGEKEQHLEDQERFKLVSGVLVVLNFSAYIARMKRAESFGPFLDPTAFLKKGADLRIDIQAAEIIQEAAGKLRKLYGLSDGT